MEYQDIADRKIEFVINPSVVFKEMEGILTCYVPESGKYYQFTDQEREIIQIYMSCDGDNKEFLARIEKDADLLEKTKHFFDELSEAQIILVVRKNGSFEP